MELGVHFIDFLPGGPEKLGPTLGGAAKAADLGGARLRCGECPVESRPDARSRSAWRSRSRWVSVARTTNGIVA